MTDQTHRTAQNTQQGSGYDRAKGSASDAARRASETIEANPLAVVAGGLAVGALAGALLPRSAKEKELLAPVGKRLGETARHALAAAKEAGTQELDGAGLTPSSARDRGKELLGSLGKALSSAGTAAAQAAKSQGKQDAQQGQGGQKTSAQSGGAQTGGAQAGGSQTGGSQGSGAQSGSGPQAGGAQGGGASSGGGQAGSGAAKSPTPMQA